MPLNLTRLNKFVSFASHHAGLVSRVVSATRFPILQTKAAKHLVNSRFLPPVITNNNLASSSRISSRSYAKSSDSIDPDASSRRASSSRSGDDQSKINQAILRQLYSDYIATDSAQHDTHEPSTTILKPPTEILEFIKRTELLDLAPIVRVLEHLVDEYNTLFKLSTRSSAKPVPAKTIHARAKEVDEVWTGLLRARKEEVVGAELDGNLRKLLAKAYQQSSGGQDIQSMAEQVKGVGSISEPTARSVRTSSVICSWPSGRALKEYVVTSNVRNNHSSWNLPENTEPIRWSPRNPSNSRRYNPSRPFSFPLFNTLNSSKHRVTCSVGYARQSSIDEALFRRESDRTRRKR